MLKRLTGVVTVKDGWAVQSIGYRRYLPIGRPECLVENLDRWGVDEIFVQCIDRSFQQKGPDFDLLSKLANLGTGTPLIFGGGISTVEQGVRAIQAGADRLLLDAMLRDSPENVYDLGRQLGVQALIASVPVARGTNGVEWWDYRKGTYDPLSNLTKFLEARLVSEALLIDHRNEGIPQGFDPTLIDDFPCRSSVPLIVFGGISHPQQMQSLLARDFVAAVAVGNFLNYKELAVQRLKEDINSPELRAAAYETQHSLLHK